MSSLFSILWWMSENKPQIIRFNPLKSVKSCGQIQAGSSETLFFQHEVFKLGAALRRQK
jgi:hypothetical protein